MKTELSMIVEKASKKNSNIIIHFGQESRVTATRQSPKLYYKKKIDVPRTYLI